MMAARVARKQCLHYNLQRHNERTVVALKSLQRAAFSSWREILQDPQRLRQDHTYCVDFVRDRDREGYLCGLLMPTASQKSYFALRAWNAELASIKDGSSRLRGGSDSSFALMMKFQRYRDVLDAIYSTESSSSPFATSFLQDPIVSSLFRAVEEHRLTKRFLERLVDARENDLDVTQFNTMNELVTYTEDTSSSLLYLSLECTGVADDAADVVASHVGVGVGLTNTLRAAPLLIMQGEIPFPQELLPPRFPYGALPDCVGDTSLSSLPSPEYQQSLLEAIQEMASLASEHLQQAQSMQSQVPKEGRQALLPVVPALNYLNNLHQKDYNVFHPNLVDNTRLKLMFLLSRAWLSGVF